MANVLGQITVNDTWVLEVDSDPSVGGATAPISSIAVLNDGSGTNGSSWVKTGSASTAWSPVINVTSVATGTGLTGGPITSSGTISFATIATGNILANISGSTAAPTPNTLTAIMDSAIGSTQGSIIYRNASSWVALTPGTSGQVLRTNGAGANPSWAAVGGTGTVTSVALADGSTTPIYAITGSPVTGAGTLTFSLSNQSANTIFAGPASGAAAQPTFRSHVLADLPQLTNGQLYIGSTGSSVVASTLTAGSGISITNNAGSITIAATSIVGTGLKIKSGTVAAGSFTGNPKTFAVTFSAAFASTAYAIMILGTDNRNWSWQSKATTGFTINSNANTALTGNVDWIAIATGESN